MKRALGLAGFLVLTLLTQVGGIAQLLVWLLVRFTRCGRLRGWRRHTFMVAAFAATYAVLTLAVVPPLAALGGRVLLPCWAAEGRPFAAASPLYCALNRHYVVPRLADLLGRLAADLDARYPGTITLYLDAGFPFLEGLPMLPHLSHKDGRKLDLAYWYDDANGAYLPGRLRSPIGFWAFEPPASGEPAPCPEGQWPTLRWDMALLQPLWPDLKLDEPRTRAALEWLFTEGRAFGVERVFVEPHLAKRLGVASPLLGFQGCRAARHDDHIHLQIGP